MHRESKTGQRVWLRQFLLTGGIVAGLIAFVVVKASWEDGHEPADQTRHAAWDKISLRLQKPEQASHLASEKHVGHTLAVSSPNAGTRRTSPDED